MPGGVKFWDPVDVRADIVANAGVPTDAERAATPRVVNCEITLGTGSNVGFAVVPFAGTISKIYSVISEALTTGDETLSFAVTGGTSMGDIVITQSGSAAGDVDSLTPSANNTVAAGDTIDVTTDGANGTAAIAKISVLIVE